MHMGLIQYKLQLPRCQKDHFTVGSGLFMGFVENKKNVPAVLFHRTVKKLYVNII